MKIILRMLKPYWFFVILAPMFILIESALELLLPKLMIELIDNSAMTGDKQYIFETARTMGLYTLCAVVTGVIGLFFSSYVSQKVGTDLRNELFEKIQKFSFNNIDAFKTPSLITRLTNDITQIQLLITTALRQLTKAIIMCIGAIVMSYGIHSQLAHILSVSSTVLFIAIIIILSKSFTAFDRFQEKLDDVNGIMRESLAGIRVVKNFVREDYEIGKFENVNKSYRKSGVDAYLSVMGLFPVFMIVLNCSVVLILLFGGFEVSYLNLKPEEIMALITYLLQMMTGLLVIGSGFSQIARAKTSLERIEAIFNEEIDIVDGHMLNENIEKGFGIEYKNVSFQYKNSENEQSVIDDVSFIVKNGNTLGILGETGSGKSTLMHLLVRLYDVSSGEILLDGVNIKDYKLEELHSKISMVLQDTTLFTGTIRENVKWGKSDATDEEVIEACKSAKAHDFIMKFPNGYDTILGQKGINLSGGQKQRISIARSLIRKPSVIVFDDSTSAVDSITEAEITNAMNNYHKESSKIIIAQRVSSVIHLDKIIVLQNGQIVAQGSHENLIKHNEYYKEIYYSQKQMGGVVIE